MRPLPLVTTLLGLALAAGCARDARPYTPTTLGTDFSKVPRGRMVPQAFPGTDLAKSRSKVDPATATASADEAKLPLP